MKNTSPLTQGQRMTTPQNKKLSPRDFYLNIYRGTQVHEAFSRVRSSLAQTTSAYEKKLFFQAPWVYQKKKLLEKTRTEIQALLGDFSPVPLSMNGNEVYLLQKEVSSLENAIKSIPIPHELLQHHEPAAKDLSHIKQDLVHLLAVEGNAHVYMEHHDNKLLNLFVDGTFSTHMETFQDKLLHIKTSIEQEISTVFSLDSRLQTPVQDEQIDHKILVQKFYSIAEVVYQLGEYEKEIEKIKLAHSSNTIPTSTHYKKLKDIILRLHYSADTIRFY